MTFPLAQALAYSAGASFILSEVYVDQIKNAIETYDKLRKSMLELGANISVYFCLVD